MIFFTPDPFCKPSLILIKKVTNNNLANSKTGLREIININGSKAQIFILRGILFQVTRKITNLENLPDRSNPHMSLFVTLFGEALASPNAEIVVCDLFDRLYPRLEEILRPTQNFIYQFGRNFFLSTSQIMTLAQCLTKCKTITYKTIAYQYLKTKCEHFMTMFIETENNRGEKENRKEFANCDLQYIKYLLDIAENPEYCICPKLKTLFMEKLRLEFPREDVPSLLAPYLYPKRTGRIPATISNDLKYFCYKMEPEFTLSAEVFIENINNYGIRELTAHDIGQIVITVIQYHIPKERIDFWNKKAVKPSSNKWNLRVLTECLTKLSPGLNWVDVILALDHPSFHVPDLYGLRKLFIILKLAFIQTGFSAIYFPTKSIFRIWSNKKCLWSLLYALVRNPSVMSLNNYILDYVSLNFFVCTRDITNNLILIWRNYYLCECLMSLADQGHTIDVNNLIIFPIKNCPDVLLFSLLQINNPMTKFREDLLIELVLVLLDNPKCGNILIYAWNINISSVQNILLRALEKWYFNGEKSQRMLTQILDLAEAFNALPRVLKSKSHRFTIDLAILAFQEVSFNYEGFLIDKITEFGNPFISTLLETMQKHGVNMQQRFNRISPKTVKTTLLCVEMFKKDMNPTCKAKAYRLVSITRLLPAFGDPAVVHLKLSPMLQLLYPKVSKVDKQEIKVKEKEQQILPRYVVTQPSKYIKNKIKYLYASELWAKSEIDCDEFSLLLGDILVDTYIYSSEYNTVSLLNCNRMMDSQNKQITMSHSLFNVTLTVILSSINVRPDLVKYGLEAITCFKSSFKELNTFHKYLKNNPTYKKMPPTILDFIENNIFIDRIQYINKKHVTFKDLQEISVESTNSSLSKSSTSPTVVEITDNTIDYAAAVLPSSDAEFKVAPDTKYDLADIQEALKTAWENSEDWGHKSAFKKFEDSTPVPRTVNWEWTDTKYVNDAASAWSIDNSQTACSAKEDTSRMNMDSSWEMDEVLDYEYEDTSSESKPTVDIAPMNHNEEQTCFLPNPTDGWTFKTKPWSDPDQTNISLHYPHEKELSFMSDHAQFLYQNANYLFSTYPYNQPMNLAMEIIEVIHLLEFCAKSKNGAYVYNILNRVINGLIKFKDEDYSSSEINKDVLKQFRKNHIEILNIFKSDKIYGRMPIVSEVTSLLFGASEYYGYNLSAFDCMLKNGFIDILKVDYHLSRQLTFGNKKVMKFVEELLEHYFYDARSNLIKEIHLYRTIDALREHSPIGKSFSMKILCVIHSFYSLYFGRCSELLALQDSGEMNNIKIW